MAKINSQDFKTEELQEIIIEQGKLIEILSSSKKFYFTQTIKLAEKLGMYEFNRAR